jgi:hypothetical protein
MLCMLVMKTFLIRKISNEKTKAAEGGRLMFVDPETNF